MQRGVPSWQKTERTQGVIGTPLVDTRSRFLRTATYGDVLDIEVIISEWLAQSFVQRFRIMRGEELIMECDEARILAGRRADNPEAIRSLPISPDICRLCEKE